MVPDGLINITPKGTRRSTTNTVSIVGYSLYGRRTIWVYQLVTAGAVANPMSINRQTQIFLLHTFYERRYTTNTSSIVGYSLDGRRTIWAITW